MTRPDKLHLEAAEGWLMLGDADSARKELDEISPSARALPEVLEIEWGVHARLDDWTAAYATARQIVDREPDRVSGWIHRAYALRRMPGGGLEKAWEGLRPAWDRFPREFLVPYNLACYAARMGKPDDAWDWIQRAMSAGSLSVVRSMALADPDLEAIWPRLKRRRSNRPPT